MGKIVFDSFSITDACYEKFSTDSNKKDDCRVTAEIHERDKKDPSSVIHFYRDKTSYLFTPEDAPKVPKLREMGFDDKDNALQSQISIFVEMSYQMKANHLDKLPNLKDVLSPISAKLIAFIAAGDLETPDEIQSKALASILSDLLSLSPEGRADLLSFVDSLAKSKWIPDTNRPRAEFLNLVLKLDDDVSKTADALKDDAAIQEAIKNLPLQLALFIGSGQGKEKDLDASIDKLQVLLSKNTKTPSEMKDVYVFLSKKLESLGKSSALSNNLEMRRRFNLITGYLRIATDKKYSELLALAPDAALQRYLNNDLSDAAQTGNLATRVKSELDNAHLDPDWLKDHANEIVSAIAPNLSLQMPKAGTIPSVKVDMKGLEMTVNSLIAKHGIQEREYRIGVLSVLRYFFGRDLNGNKISGWANNQEMSLDVNFSTDQLTQLQNLGQKMKGRITTSQVGTDILLPIGEGLILAGGISMTIGGHVLDGNDRTPLNVVGPSLIGLGTGALICHLAWKSRNPYLTDSVCGGGGLGTGIAVGWFSTQPKTPPKPPGPRIDGRNPTRPDGP
jgi:hypothetical protein